MSVFLLHALCLGHWVKILLLSTRSKKESMTVSCIICLFVVVGFHCMQYLWIIPFFFWKRQAHLNLCFLGARREGGEECKCSAPCPAGSQMHQQGRVPGWLGWAGADTLLPAKWAWVKLPGGCWLKVIRKLWSGPALHCKHGGKYQAFLCFLCQSMLWWSKKN